VLVRSIIGAPDAATDEFIRRLVFVIASGNSDAHLKNWSLLYPDRVSPALSPVYDQVSTVGWSEIMKKLALKLAGVRRFEDITRETFARFAVKAGLEPPRVLTIVDEMLENLEAAWEVVRRTGRWKMLPAQTDALREHWRRTPLLAASPLGRDS
jgi:serine/threonine-protein kinase HipA